ncbi:DNA polymerase III subunit alpha [Actinotalea sp. BY-33]|uniref:Error-prone DNA polymerase n=1 Tax=Actinotalea soli TaxID=2819234 RepID=A0A939RU48_9CELL|nr:DNA polymerase III subunit alpha [Actinotalea soli]MBO1750233.1 DNA polymerase III subunit alpha [Actinotalea soli]
MTERPRSAQPAYAELHAHSAFSFLDGASQPEELVAEAARLGLSALALTDHDGLYGVVRFAQAARSVGLPTVFGAELHLPGPDGVLDPPTGVPDPRATHLLVLARGPEGYRALSRAVAEAHLATGSKGAADYRLDQLGAAAQGQWLVLTGCRKGAVRHALEGGGGGLDLAAAGAELDRLTAVFGTENVAVEVTDTGDPRDSERCDALAELARTAGLPLVATGNVHYARPADADLAAALAAVRARSSLDEVDGWLPGAGGLHLRSPREMAHRHRRRPEAVATAAALAAECAFDLALVAPALPPYPVPPGHDEASWLRELVRRGALERYGPRGSEKVAGAWAQLDHELAVIESLGFPGYFLIVHDLVAFCRDRGILAQGRGSAANSAVCYALGVTAVDAVHHGLLFERFLAPERDGPPDIDVDIESIRREEVIQHVYERFDREHAAQVANVISYRPRSAVRDAARALGYDVGQQDAWSKSIERWGSLRGPERPSPWWTLERSAPVGPLPAGSPGASAAAASAPRPALPPAGTVVEGGHDVVPARRPPAASELGEIPDAVIDLADRFLRLPRHLGIHSGGMVLCDRPVIEVCPVEWARMPGRTVLQWDKEDCADAGLVKFDLLGLGMLSALRIAFGLVAEHQGVELGLHTLPQEDPGVYDLLCAADTVGVFQVESRAQMATLPRLQPRCFYDIVIEVALIRPGPIQGGSVHPYINRARGREEVTYLHPLLEKSLAKTKGVPLFQEQLMQMAIDVAGFTGAEADQLRRAMGSKRSAERMEALHARLLSGMAERGIGPEVGEQVYDKLKAFADFGFPESHAYSFAYLVYASSWLKRRHPAAFYAGLLAAQPMGFYSPQSLVADARRHGLTVLRPCVQASGVQAGLERVGTAGGQPVVDDHVGDLSVVEGAAVDGLGGDGFADPGARPGRTGRQRPGLIELDVEEGLAVRLGLASIRGIGETLAEALVAERAARGRFADLRDMVRRVGLSTAQIESLATAGALGGLGVERREALWAAGALALEGPDTLPGVAVGVQAPTLPGMSEVELAMADVWATGVSVDSYPTQYVREGLDAAGVLRVEQAMLHEPGRRVAVAGVVTHRQRPGTAQGVTFLSIEDETGLLNVICTAGLWRRFRTIARSSAALVVRGRLERADGATNLLAEHLSPLSLQIPSRSRDFQ